MNAKTALASFETLKEVDLFASRVRSVMVERSQEHKTDGKYSCKVSFFAETRLKIPSEIKAFYGEGAYPYKNWSAYEKFALDIYNPQSDKILLHVSLGNFEKIVNLEPETWNTIEVPVKELENKSVEEIILFQKFEEMKEKVSVLYMDNIRLEGGNPAEIEKNKKVEDSDSAERKPPPLKKTEAAKVLPEFSSLGKITRKIDVPVVAKTQILVVGAGLAGVAAAVCAARKGTEVLLVERAGWLGGMATSGLVPIIWNTDLSIALDPEVNKGIVKEFEGLLKKLGGEREWRNPQIMKYVLFKMCQEAGVKILLYTLTTDVIVKNDTIKGIIVENKSGTQAILSDIVIDVTGDGDVAAKAGAPFEIGRGRDSGTQTVTLVFMLGDVDTNRIKQHCGNYNEVFDKARESKEFYVPDMGGGGCIEIVVPGEHGVVDVNAVNVGGLDNIDVRDLTYAQVECTRQIMDAVKVYRKYCPGFENCFLIDMAAYMGVRESRRIMGEYLLTGADVMNARKFEDGVAKGRFLIDVHTWDYRGDVGGAWTPVFEIPYRSLVPLKIENLLVAGRCISADHAAHAALRIQGTTMAIGQAAGVAAGLCIKEKVSPRKLNPALLVKVLGK